MTKGRLEAFSDRVLWANLHLLFWLSLVSFATGWMGENHFATRPVALYGVVLLLSGVAYYILSRVLIAAHGIDSHLGQALGKTPRALSPWCSTLSRFLWHFFCRLSPPHSTSLWP